MTTDVNGVPTRLERLTGALLQSDYVKMAYIQAGEIVAMARLIELELDLCAGMDKPTATAHLYHSKP